MNNNTKGAKPEKFIPLEKSARKINTNLGVIKNNHKERCKTLAACAEGDTKAKRFALLKTQFTKQGYTLDQFGSNDCHGPVICLTERGMKSWVLSMFGGASNFPTQLGDCCHAF